MNSVSTVCTVKLLKLLQLGHRLCNNASSLNFSVSKLMWCMSGLCDNRFVNLFHLVSVYISSTMDMLIKTIFSFEDMLYLVQISKRQQKLLFISVCIQFELALLETRFQNASNKFLWSSFREMFAFDCWLILESVKKGFCNAWIVIQILFKMQRSPLDKI